jgi:hypothetical protein
VRAGVIFIQNGIYRFSTTMTSISKSEQNSTHCWERYQLKCLIQGPLIISQDRTFSTLTTIIITIE